MAADPVATAASNNPLLKTLVAAVSGKFNPEVEPRRHPQRWRVHGLRAGRHGVRQARPRRPSKTLSTPKGAKTLQTVLTYHVIPGQISPDEIDGTQKTVQGGSVEVTGSGDDIKVNGAKRDLRWRQDRQRDRLPHRHVLMPKM